MTIRVALATAAVIACASLLATGAMASRVGAPEVTWASSSRVVEHAAGLQISGTVRCPSKRFFSLLFMAVEPGRSAAAVGWGNYPVAGAAPATHMCRTAGRAWRVVLGQGTKQTPGTFGRGTVRVCAMLRVFAPHARSTLDATCTTLPAR